MKQKLSISMDSKKVEIIEKLISKNSLFRNKSHVIEHAVDVLLKNIEKEV